MGNSSLQTVREEELEFIESIGIDNTYLRKIDKTTDVIKVEQNLKKYTPEELSSKKLVVLLLSGSFNPVHRMHFDMLEIARQYIEKKFGEEVIIIGGFLATSSDGHVRSKVGDNLAITIKHRNELLKVVTAESDWISWCGMGNPSGHFTLSLVLTLLESKFGNYLNNNNNNNNNERNGGEVKDGNGDMKMKR